MKMIKSKYFWVMGTIILAIGYIASCTKENQILDVATTNEETDLICAKTSTAPTIDGTIEDIWNSATKLKIVPEVRNVLWLYWS